MQDVRRKILVAGMGTNPSVLTQAVWALAHQNPPIVPDEVVVIMTKSGSEQLKQQLLVGAPSVWVSMMDDLRKEGIDVEDKLAFGEATIHIIPDAKGNWIEDLRSSEDNLRAADFMLRQLRQYTEASDTVVYASIAGGRKSMSALLLSCMTLLGREDDKVFHVLLPKDLEGRVEPTMYYPRKGVVYTNRTTGKKIKGDKTLGELFEVPYVRMRGWYQEKFKTLPPTYQTLISKVQTVAPRAVAYPEIEIDAWNAGVTIGGLAVNLSRPCFAALLLLAGGWSVKDLHARLLKAHEAKGCGRCDWLATFQEGSLFSNPSFTEDLAKTLSNLRKKLKECGMSTAEALVPQRGNPVMFPLNRIKWRNLNRLADLCSCLAPKSP